VRYSLHGRYAAEYLRSRPEIRVLQSLEAEIWADRGAVFNGNGGDLIVDPTSYNGLAGTLSLTPNKALGAVLRRAFHTVDWRVPDIFLGTDRVGGGQAPLCARGAELSNVLSRRGLDPFVQQRKGRNSLGNRRALVQLGNGSGASLPGRV